MSVSLGDKVKDRVTGLEGIVMGVCKWITGCDQAAVQPGVIKDGKVIESSWFVVTRLDVIKPGAVVIPQIGAKPGGPQTGY